MKRFKTISEFHKFRQLPPPEHPLISVTEFDVVKQTEPESMSWCYDFYAIGLKRVSFSDKINFRYGQQPYDFNEGILSFVAPNQVLSLRIDAPMQVKQSGWLLLVHPDFLWNTPMGKSVKNYDFWDYDVHESLFLSAKEETTVIHILQHLQQECRLNIDKFTKSIIVSHLETLLNYADRFYHRQFITREKANHEILQRVENLLSDYFSSDNLMEKGIPTVAHVAASLNLSAKYLSAMLKVLTGQNTQQHIHDKLIEKAKEQLSTTNLTVSEIAYGLGFEHIQSFSKLFKTKTQQSPVEFRAAFN